MREKETYAIVTMEAFIALSREATHGGVGPLYESGLDFLLSFIPSREQTNKKYMPTETLLRLANHARNTLKRYGFADIAPVPDGKTQGRGPDGNPAVNADGTPRIPDRTYFDFRLWLDQLYPSDWDMPRTDPKVGALDHFRTQLKAQMITDLVDDMGMLRFRLPVSEPERASAEHMFEPTDEEEPIEVGVPLEEPEEERERERDEAEQQGERDGEDGL
jgi:hypothetical protein